MADVQIKSGQRGRGKREDSATEQSSVSTSALVGNTVSLVDIKVLLDSTIREALISFETTVTKIIDDRFALLEKNLTAYDERFQVVEGALDACQDNMKNIENRISNLEANLSDSPSDNNIDALKKEIVEMKMRANHLITKKLVSDTFEKRRIYSAANIENFRNKLNEVNWSRVLDAQTTNDKYT